MATKHTVEIPTSTIRDAFSISLAQSPMKRGNFFCDIRSAFKKQLESVFNAHGLATFPDSTLGYMNYLRESRSIPGNTLTKFTGRQKDVKKELDMKFCAKYGHEDYSLKAINYLDRAYCELPSLLPFTKVKNFSIGNVLIFVENGDYEVDVKLGEGLRAVGYVHKISSRKRNLFFAYLAFTLIIAC